jgi:hypothetical protein
MQQARALDEGFELALALATRAAGRRGGGAAAAATDQHEADAIFACLGVQRVVLTWSERPAGEPLLATGGLETMPSPLCE